NVTEYMPGLRSTIRYWPVGSVAAVRTFSMSAGLATSTVTPGRTAPDVSRTTPVIAACARAEDGRRTRVRTPVRTQSKLRMWPPDASEVRRRWCGRFYRGFIRKATRNGAGRPVFARSDGGATD